PTCAWRTGTVRRCALRPAGRAAKCVMSAPSTSSVRRFVAISGAALRPVRPSGGGSGKRPRRQDRKPPHKNAAQGFVSAGKMHFGCVAMNRSLRLFSAAVLGFCRWAAPAFANKSPEERRAEIREMRADVLTELYKEKPATEAQIRKAAGYAVFSNVG